MNGEATRDEGTKGRSHEATKPRSDEGTKPGSDEATKRRNGWAKGTSAARRRAEGREAHSRQGSGRKCHTMAPTGKACFAAVCACVMLWHAGGCAGLPGARLEAAMAQSAEALAKKIGDEGVLQEWMVDADGNVQDPGLESYVKVTIASGVRAVGINGEITARGHGDSTRLPAGMRESLIKQLDGPISDEQRRAILEILGWNRTPAGGTPAAGG